MLIKKLNFLFSQYWKHFIIALAILAVSYLLLFRGLGSLVPDYTVSELSSQQQSQSLKTIYNNPINAPYKLTVWVGLKLGHHSLMVTRLAATIFASFIALLFYWVAMHWYSKRIAIIATIMFISSSSFLAIGRFGTGLILQMATLLLMSCVLFYRRSLHETWVTYGIISLLALCLYIPGFFWFELLGIIVLNKKILHRIRRFSILHRSLMIFLACILVSPLVWRASHNLNLFLSVLALPTQLPSLTALLDNALHLGSSVIFRGYWSPEYWLYKAPLLNIWEIIAFIAGLFVLFQTPHFRANYFLFGTLSITIILIILGGAATITMLVPLIYLVIAGGVFYLLDQWLTVFPRNPIARFAGTAMIVILVGFSVFYHTRAYFTAWPNTPETKLVYNVKQPS